MGNLCGKPSNDAFSGPGRTLESAPPPRESARATVPSTVRSQGRTVGGPPRTLGGEEGRDDPRSAAARAAEERASTQRKGRLQAQLDTQKKQTRSETLDQVARENRRGRDADVVAESRNYN